MNIIIAGSRWIGAPIDGKPMGEVVKERHLIFGSIHKGVEMFGAPPEDSLFIVGRSTGVDMVAEAWVDVVRAKKKAMPAAWETLGKRAGVIRNLDMAREAGPNGGLILIWDGESKGSQHMLDTARKTGMRIFELVYPKKPLDRHHVRV